MEDWADDVVDDDHEEKHAIPLQAASPRCDAVESVVLPSSPTLAQVDVTIELPFVTPAYALAIQAKRAVLVKNALVASNVTACRVATLVQIVQQHVREGGASVECDEYMEMLRLLPEIRGSEAFQPLEDTLRRLYRSFHASRKPDLVQLGIGSLLLVRGTMKEKVAAAIHLVACGAAAGAGVAEEPPFITSKTTLSSALNCLLLGVTALFDDADANDEQLQATAEIVDCCAQETANLLWIALEVDEQDEIVVDAVWQWLNEKSTKMLAWLRLVDHAKWPTTKRLTSSPTSPRSGAVQPRDDDEEDEGHHQPPLSEAPTTTNGDSDGPPALSFRFSGVDGGAFSIGEQEADELFDLLQESAFTKVHAQTMYDTFVQHTGDGLLEEDTFLQAVEELVSMTNQSHLMQNSDFLGDMEMIFRCFLPENGVHVDAIEIAAGFSIFAWGSKSDKLSSAFHYFDGDSKGFLDRQQLWRFLRSVLTVLLFLSPPEENVIKRYGSITELVDTGEQEMVEFIVDGLGDEEKNGATSELRMGAFTFEAFGEWYNSGGFKGMSWLELLDLRKWTFVSPHFQCDQLDSEPVDPVVASTNYYTAQNIQVDVDRDDEEEEHERTDMFQQQRHAFPHAIEEEDDEDGNDDVGPHAGFLHSGSSYSSATTGPSQPPSHYASTPVVLLRNEIVLQFDLAFDTDDDSAADIPVDCLSFSNGDVLQYYELQRVMRLHEVPLSRVDEVFGPHMESSSTAWMEKSTFDECIKELLPPEIANGVASSFGIHPNSRVPPPSIGRAHEYKMVADTLSRLFFAFNRGGTGKIDLVEFMAAFTLFCAGSKSEKLAFAYRLFDTDGDGALSRREMWKYLRSFLTVLLALGNGSELSAEAIASVADATAIAIADAMFRDTNKTFSIRQAPSFPRQSHRFSLDTPDSAETVVASRTQQLRRGQYYHRGSLPNVDGLSIGGANVSGAGAGSAFVRGGVVTFQEFAVWYSTRGYNTIAWIELLDSRKWPQISDDIADAILRYISRQRLALAGASMRGSRSSGDRDSGSVVTTSSSNGSRMEEGRSSSMEAEYSVADMTMLNTTSLLKEDGNQGIEAAMESVAGVRGLILSPTSTTSSAKNLNSVGLQFKLTNFDNTVLRIRLKDVAIVYTVAERMGFRALACEALLNVFNTYGSGRSLTKIGFLKSMRDQVPRDVLTNEDQEFLSFHLLRIFTLFEAESVLDDDVDDDYDGGGEAEAEAEAEADNTGGARFSGGGEGDIRATSSVEKLHLMAGMSIFCGGSKSAKLGVLFRLFDTHGDGYVSRRHMFEMFKSVLVVLFAFSSFNSNKAHTNDTSMNTWSTNSAAERVAGAVISKLFCEAQCRHADSISLPEFATWYAGGGYMDCPWVELLDLTKWPAKEAFEASKTEKPFHGFAMSEEDNLLHFSESDISTYLFVLRSTKLSELNVNKLYDALLAYATPSAEEVQKMRAQPSLSAATNMAQSYSYAAFDDEQGAYLELTRSNFYECIRSLVPKDDMSEKAQQTSSKLLSRLFNVFDRRKCGRANVLELVCGLSILGRGSKSQKLSMAFEFITKMQQQRHRTIDSFATANTSFAGGGARTGGGGINSISTGGGVFGWLTSARGATSTATGLRRSGLQQQQEVNALSHSVISTYLRSFLLALMALSDSTYRLGLERMYTEADEFIEEAIGDLMTEVRGNGSAGAGGYAGFGTSRSPARVTFEQFGEWYNTSGYELISWVELLDVKKWEMQQEADYQSTALSRTAAGKYKSARSQRHVATARLVEPVDTTTKPRTVHKKQVRQSDIVPTTYDPHRNREDTQQQAPLSVHRESTTSAAILSLDGPFMVFAIDANSADLQFFMEDVTRLKVFLQETHVHQLSPRQVSETLLAALQISSGHARVEVLSRTFTLAVQTGFTRGHPLSDESADLLDAVLRVFVEERMPRSSSQFHTGIIDSNLSDAEDPFPNDPLDAHGVVCGMFVFCDGSLLDKLKAAARLFDETLAQHAVDTTLETIHECLKCMLMAFYGMSCSLSGDVVRESAQRGAEDVLRAFVGSSSSLEDSSPSTRPNGTPLDLALPVSLNDFSDWFTDSGYHSHPWLELTELTHWPVALHIRGAPESSTQTE